MTTGSFENRADEAWLCVSQQEVNLVLRMPAVSGSLAPPPARRRGPPSAWCSPPAGAAFSFLSSTERPLVSDPHARAQCHRFAQSAGTPPPPSPTQPG